MYGTVPSIHYDIMREGTIISEVHCSVANTHAMICDVLESGEGASSEDPLVSITRALSITKV